MRATELIAQTKHLLPDLDELEEYLAAEPEKVISQTFPLSERTLRARAIVQPELESMDFEELDTSVERERRRILESAQRAVSKIRAEGESAELEPDEAYGYEAIVLMVGRPAILIQNGRFFPPPKGWEILEEVRDSIERTCQSVGRIEVPGHPSKDWIGTGFLVADDVIMTNYHVAKNFCRFGDSGKWIFEPGIKPRIDYFEEFGTPESSEFALEEVIGLHNKYDLALLKVSSESPDGLSSPEPLFLASDTPYEVERRKVYALGYPAWDGHRNDPEIMRRIFTDIYGVKRLQPGEIMKVLSQDRLFQHDCSTLGGNSGSCVVDLETQLVVGLHYSGRYLEGNRAVSLWMLKNDPLIKQANVQFE